MAYIALSLDLHLVLLYIFHGLIGRIFCVYRLQQRQSAQIVDSDQLVRMLEYEKVHGIMRLSYCVDMEIGVGEEVQAERMVTLMYD